MENEKFKYYAFISYSHIDKKIAKKLQDRLEHYHLPSKLQKSCPNLPENLKPIFIDESNLIARGSLKAALQENLAGSNYLIVICSPNSAKSEYVNDEVDYFIKLGRKEHIIPLIIDGKPRADNESECFPPALLELLREYEPVLIDMKEHGERDSFLRVIAAMLELEPESFISQENRERKKRTIIYSSIAAVFAVILGAFIWYNVDFFNEMLYNAEAQFNIGVDYHNNQDYEKAFEWYLKAASNGYSKAQYNIGYMYQNGQGVKQNYEKALEWYMKAADNGNSDAQVNIGFMYFNGQGVNQDYNKAFEWLIKAADNGNSKAQYNIGFMYANGQGVNQDYEKALEWYMKAADNGNSDAQVNIGFMYFNGQGVNQDYEKAFEWCMKAADNGNSEAQNNIGFMYANGLGVNQDYEKAFEWYLKAANNGNSDAQNNVGLRYANGQGVNQDYEKAFEWFMKAANNGDSNAQDIIGSMYQNG